MNLFTHNNINQLIKINLNQNEKLKNKPEGQSRKQEQLLQYG